LEEKEEDEDNETIEGINTTLARKK